MTPRTLTRRTVLAAGAAGTLAATAAAAGGETAAADALDPELTALEAERGTTIGLVARHRGTGRELRHRPDARQPLCSTFKPLLAAALLVRGDCLDRVVRYDDGDLVEHAPVTGERRAMTVGELADAAIRFSDNPAGNLLLRRLGGERGPAVLTAFLRRTGDRVTRLDRFETELNSAVPGDPRDTTTPRALAATYERLVCGDVLDARDRWVLRGWLQSSTTSVDRFRSGLPTGWWCADKTGSGSYGVANDAGVVTAPDGTELVFAIQTRRSTTDPDATADPTLMADLARLLVRRLA